MEVSGTGKRLRLRLVLQPQPRQLVLAQQLLARQPVPALLLAHRQRQVLARLSKNGRTQTNLQSKKIQRNY